jgi:hypothetical protein
MTSTVLSRSAVPIRLTDERWTHILDEHCELAGFHEQILETIRSADRVLQGGQAELLAVRTVEIGKVMVVVYREISADDGFVITAFLTRRLENLNRRRQLWPLSL